MSALKTDKQARFSLAYGTPPLIHRTQYDVPFLRVEDLCKPNSTASQISAASCFVALTTLTDVLGHCLEHVYRLDNDYIRRPDIAPFDLERLLTDWEDSLDEHLRRLVIRGTGLVAQGAANLRLSYLSVKLLIRRSQLEYDKSTLHISDVDSVYYIQARRVCEEVVDFVRELTEEHCRDFWIPPNAYTLTSATTFLIRCALTSRGPSNNPSLKLARAMLDGLQLHRDNYSWDVADNCLDTCSDLIEKIEAACTVADTTTSSQDFQDFQEPMLMDMDMIAMNGFFSDFAGPF